MRPFYIEPSSLVPGRMYIRLGAFSHFKGGHVSILVDFDSHTGFTAFIQRAPEYQRFVPETPCVSGIELLQWIDRMLNKVIEEGLWEEQGA